MKAFLIRWQVHTITSIKMDVVNIKSGCNENLVAWNDDFHSKESFRQLWSMVIDGQLQEG